MKHSRFTTAATLFAAIIFSSCNTLKNVPDDITPQELLREAQNAYDRGSARKALAYYDLLAERFGDDAGAYVVARYEAAHIYVKKHKYAKAEPILQEVIEIYRNVPAGTLSGSYLKMAETDLAKIPQKKRQMPKKEPNKIPVFLFLL